MAEELCQVEQCLLSGGASLSDCVGGVEGGNGQNIVLKELTKKQIAPVLVYGKC